MILEGYKAQRRRDQHQRRKNREFRRRVRAGSTRVLLIGDSLTRRWEDHLPQWETHLAGLGSVNFGVGGDRIENLLWRITKGPMPKTDPDVIVMMIGTNNLPTDPSDKVLGGLSRIICELDERYANSDIIILGILPRNPDQDGRSYGSAINEVNAGLKAFCDDFGHHWLDLGPFLPRKGAVMDPAVMPDGLHLNGAGYDLVGPVLKDAIGKVLEARSERDA